MVPLVKPEVGTGQPCVVIVAKTGRVLYIKRENKTKQPNCPKLGSGKTC